MLTILHIFLLPLSSPSLPPPLLLESGGPDFGPGIADDSGEGRVVREGGGEEGEVGGGVESQDAETSEQPWKAVRSVVQKHFILRTIKVCLIKF